MTALETIKSAPQSHATLVLITNDGAAQKVMIGWTLYKVEPYDYPGTPKITFQIAFDRLWDKLLPLDYDELSKLSGVPSTRCNILFYRLRKANLVYPDGTISKIATELLSGQVIAHIRGLIPRGK